MAAIGRERQMQTAVRQIGDTADHLPAGDIEQIKAPIRTVPLAGPSCCGDGGTIRRDGDAVKRSLARRADRHA